MLQRLFDSCLRSIKSVAMCYACGGGWPWTQAPTQVAAPPVKNEYIYLDSNPAFYPDYRTVSCFHPRVDSVQRCCESERFAIALTKGWRLTFELHLLTPPLLIPPILPHNLHITTPQAHRANAQSLSNAIPRDTVHCHDGSAYLLHLPGPLSRNSVRSDRGST